MGNSRWDQTPSQRRHLSIYIGCSCSLRLYRPSPDREWSGILLRSTAWCIWNDTEKERPTKSLRKTGTCAGALHVKEKYIVDAIELTASSTPCEVVRTTMSDVAKQMDPVYRFTTRTSRISQNNTSLALGRIWVGKWASFSQTFCTTHEENERRIICNMVCSGQTICWTWKLFWKTWWIREDMVTCFTPRYNMPPGSRLFGF